MEFFSGLDQQRHHGTTAIKIDRGLPETVTDCKVATHKKFI